MKKLMQFHWFGLAGWLLFCFLSPAHATSVPVAYRLLSPEGAWEPAEEVNNNNDLRFCSVYKDYESGYRVYFSKAQKTLAAVFALPHQRIIEGERSHVILEAGGQVYADEQVAIDMDGVVRINLNPRALADIDKTKDIRLTVNSFGYSFPTDGLRVAIGKLSECMGSKMAVWDDQLRRADKADKDANEKLYQAELGTSYITAFDGALNPSNNLSSVQAVSAVSEPGDDTEVAAIEGLNEEKHSVIASSETVDQLASNNTEEGITEAMSMEASELAKSAGAVENIDTGVTGGTAAESIFEEVGETAANDAKQSFVRSVSTASSSPLTMEEQELFESMKTKLFLLEREKEAARKKLTDLRQMEIEVMKVDIGNLQKIEEQAAKISILEEKLKAFGYGSVQKGQRKAMLQNPVDARQEVEQATGTEDLTNEGEGNEIDAEEAGENASSGL